MIRPCCDLCGDELTKFGALLLGPLKNDGSLKQNGKAKKQHICVPSCYRKLRRRRDVYYSVEEAEKFGPILFGPPRKNGMVDRLDISVACYRQIQKELFSPPRK